MGIEDSGPTLHPFSKNFLESLLKKKIIDFKASEGSTPGDNYTSILIALQIYLEDIKDPLHLLYKTFPNHPTRQKLLEDTNLFLKEYQVYNTWLPELIDFQKSVVGNDEILKLAMPQMVAGAAIDYENDSENWDRLDPMLNNFVLMVDVRKTYGFQMANKLKSLNYDHVKVVLNELAKYHALSHAYRNHHNLPNIRSKFPFIEDPFFCNPNQKPTLDAMCAMGIDLIVKTLSDFLLARPEIAKSLYKFQNPGTFTDYLHLFLNSNGMDEEKVERFMRTHSKEFVGAPLQDQWIVAGHGDCWTNNMLFKKDENGKVTETVLVDLQIARESCIMADIVYFMYTSTDTEFRNNYLDEMLSWYHQQFLHFCKILKTKPFNGFTLENFRRKFHRSKIFGFLFAALVLPIILQKPESTVNMDTIKTEMNDDSNDKASADEWAAMFQQMGRDDEDETLLRDRFTSLLSELHDEGIL